MGYFRVFSSLVFLFCENSAVLMTSTFFCQPIRPGGLLKIYLVCPFLELSLATPCGYVINSLSVCVCVCICVCLPSIVCVCVCVINSLSCSNEKKICMCVCVFVRESA